MEQGRINGGAPEHRSEKRDGYDALVVDDYPDTLHVIKMFLKREGLNCRTVLNGWAALQKIETGEIPGVVLLDIMMPGLSGYEVCRQLRKSFSAVELPVIMLTGRTDIASLVKAYQCGANDYICKPFSKAELIVKVKCHLELQQANQTFRKNLLLEKELERQRHKKVEARLKARLEEQEKLRYQINPHFLFNSLAAIRGALHGNGKTAHDMITHLAEFCKLTLSHGVENTHAIEKEILATRHYLAMEKIRYRDYLNVKVDIDKTVKNVVIPSLLLQPLIENAVKYGSMTSPDRLKVRIQVHACGRDKVRIVVSNTGRWIPKGTVHQKSSGGLGIKNVKERLKSFYPEGYRFEQKTEADRVIMRMVLPATLTES